MTTIMSFLTKKDGDPSSNFDKSDEREAAITNSSLEHMLFDSHNKEDNEGKKHIFLSNLFSGFVKHSKK